MFQNSAKPLKTLVTLEKSEKELEKYDLFQVTTTAASINSERVHKNSNEQILNLACLQKNDLFNNLTSTLQSYHLKMPIEPQEKPNSEENQVNSEPYQSFNPAYPSFRQIDLVPINQIQIDLIPTKQIPIELVPTKKIPIDLVPIKQILIDLVPFKQMQIEQAPTVQIKIDQVPINKIPPMKIQRKLLFPSEKQLRLINLKHEKLELNLVNFEHLREELFSIFLADSLSSPISIKSPSSRSHLDIFLNAKKIRHKSLIQ